MARSKKSKHVFASRGSVLLIATLLGGSAVIRIATGATAAFAEGEKPESLDLPVAANPAPRPEAPNRAEMATLFEALQAREAAVAEREAQLDIRAKSLEMSQTEIERRLEALENTEERLRSTLALAETAAEDDLARLTAVYENMKPKDAAALFSAMEPEFAAGFLARMKPDVAAKVMSGLDPQAAYSISAILAGRNAKVPKS
ncbi:MAG: hypothetical protein AAFP87_02860 [Pseudomonadota bacterium]